MFVMRLIPDANCEHRHVFFKNRNKVFTYSTCDTLYVYMLRSYNIMTLLSFASDFDYRFTAEPLYPISTFSYRAK